MAARFYQATGRLFAIVGPTAVGKTVAAIRIAERFGGEVVSADSRYLYRGMDIGTDKPSSSERAGVPHHLIDILDPSDGYSLALYQRDAYAAIDDVIARGRLPVLAGGTPLYVNAVLEGWRIPQVAPDPALRDRLQALADERGAAHLHEMLQSVDPAAAERIPPANVRRVIRALEVYHVTGVPMSQQEGKAPPPYRILQAGLRMPREDLYRRIDERVEAQIDAGLVDEVRGLLERGVSDAAPAMSAIGYREVVPYLRGEYDRHEMVERIKFSTHRYVRHQLTWLRRMPDVHWFDVLEPGWEADLERLCASFLADETDSEGRA
jgi:tRNA dimethylallyltransferase